MEIPKMLRLPRLFDPVYLQADLSMVSAADWIPHFNSRYYEGDWSVVSLRSTNGQTSQIYPDPTKSEFWDTPMLERCPEFRRVLSEFECPLLGVRLLRLRAGSVIREHRDYKLGYEDGEIRLHVPVQTSADVEFFLDGERVVMNEGECWYLNLNLPHRVANYGTCDRIHLVIDCVMNEWMQQMIEKTARTVPA